MQTEPVNAEPKRKRRWFQFSLRTLLIVIFIFMSFLCSSSALAQLHLPDWATDRGASEADLIRGITTTDSPGAARAAYRILFKKIGADGVHNLLTHKNDSIALRAAWEEVDATVPEKGPPNTLRPDRHKLDWFIGFLEGRVHAKAPQWWIDAMVESKAGRRDNIYPDMSNKQMYHYAGLGSARAPLDTTLEEKDGKVILRVGKAKVSIAAGLLVNDDDGKVRSDVSALFTVPRCYVAIHDDVGFPYVLACIDRSSGEVRWKSDVWGSYVGGTGGQFDSWITVTEQDDRVIVFGVATTGFHVEGFRSDNGANLFRVSNYF